MNDLQLRNAANLADLYNGWINDRRTTHAGRLRWKTSSGGEYLYRMRPGSDSGSSLGPRNAENEKRFQEGQETEHRVKKTTARIKMQAAICRATRNPSLPKFAGDVLRELDISGAMGDGLLVIGTNAILAYQLESGMVPPPETMGTEDFDLAGFSAPLPHGEPATIGLMKIIRRADATWTVSEESGFRLRNRDGDILDIVATSNYLKGLGSQDWLKECPLPAHIHLIGGTTVSHVVGDSSLMAARIEAPDPRRFALHKIILSEMEGRNPLKRMKDRDQAEFVLDMLREGMPHYPFDAQFRESIPGDLRATMDRIDFNGPNWTIREKETTLEVGQTATKNAARDPRRR